MTGSGSNEVKKAKIIKSWGYQHGKKTFFEKTCFKGRREKT